MARGRNPSSRRLISDKGKPSVRTGRKATGLPPESAEPPKRPPPGGGVAPPGAPPVPTPRIAPALALAAAAFTAGPAHAADTVTCDRYASPIGSDNAAGTT